MAKPSFSREVANLLYSVKGSPVQACFQCGTCAVTCPVAEFMDHSPRLLIAMINADMREEVLCSNTFWYCASCFHCTVRCPADIDIVDMMYALKRYSMWKEQYQAGLIGPKFSGSFMKMILRTGKSFEPALAPSYILEYGPKGFLSEAEMGTALVLKGRMPLKPSRIKRIKSFRRMISRIIPIGEAA